MPSPLSRALLTALSLLLCLASGIAWAFTAKLGGPYDPRWTFGWQVVWTDARLGWACLFFAITTAGLAISTVLQAREIARRHARGQCRRCGFDLRASQFRCPECGTPARQAMIEPIDPDESD